MDLSTGVILGVVAIMGINQLVMRVVGLYGRAAVYWSVQLLNLLVGTALLVWGLPGFEQYPAVSWLLGLLFFFRIAQNNHLRVKWLGERRTADRSEREAQIRAALEAGRAGSTAEAGTEE